MASFIDLALAPGYETEAAVPFETRGVWLGLGDEIIERTVANDLAVPDRWLLQRKSFRGYVGPFSALALIDNHVSGAPVLRCSGAPAKRQPDPFGWRARPLRVAASTCPKQVPDDRGTPLELCRGLTGNGVQILDVSPG